MIMHHKNSCVHFMLVSDGSCRLEGLHGPDSDNVVVIIVDRDRTAQTRSLLWLLFLATGSIVLCHGPTSLQPERLENMENTIVLSKCITQ